MGRLFGTDGVRGVVGRDLTPELALGLGRAIGAFFGKGSRILVGRDSRAGGSMIMNALVSGLQAEGVKVYLAGLAPTPSIQYGVKELGFDGGVIVTASHNPPEYNGIKVVGADGVEVSREDEAVIEEYYFRGSRSVLEWRSYINDPEVAGQVVEVHIRAVKEHVDVDSIARRRLRVVVDCANSVGSLVSPRIVRELGGKPLTINCNIDPLFPGRDPEPTPDSLRAASNLVVEFKADLGVGHDGDADRAIIIDDRGRAHWGDRSGAILTVHAAKKDPSLPRRTYTGVSSSVLVEEYLRPRGIEVRWTPVGSVVISHSIKREGGAISGFEENGGYMHVPHHIVRDGPMTLALMMELVATSDARLSDLFDQLPAYYPIKIKIPMTRKEALCGVDAVKDYYKGYRQVTIDGVKVFGDDFWILVRPSGTEAVLRIMVEARSRERAEEVVKTAESIVRRECLRIQ